MAEITQQTPTPTQTPAPPQKPQKSKEQLQKRKKRTKSIIAAVIILDSCVYPLRPQTQRDDSAPQPSASSATKGHVQQSEDAPLLAGGR